MTIPDPALGVPAEMRGRTALSDPLSVQFELVEERPAFSEAGAYAFLAGADTSVFGLPKIAVAAADVVTGAMVALVPSDADSKRLRIAGGEPVDQLHTTLVYLGDADAISDDARDALTARLRALVVDAPVNAVSAEGFGVSIFNPPGHTGDDGRERDSCIVLQVTGAEIDRVHTLVTNATRRVAGLRLPAQHTPWVPHVTLSYTDEFTEILPAAALRVGPVTFDRLRIAFAGDVIDVPLRPVS